jgi:Fur family transcriptional regulator, ferric uptake regulator
MQMGSISNNKTDTRKGLLIASRRTLNSAGIKVTHQRTAILEIIRQGKGHLDADELYRRVRKKYPQVSLSTIYRTLHLYKILGLIEEFHFDESHHHYEASAPVEHHHLVCLGCGKVVEFKLALSDYVHQNITEADDFEIVKSEVNMTGYCRQCHASRNQSQINQQ